MTPQQFIQEVAPMARVIYQHHKLSAALQIAQACLESGFGAHSPGNNLFGIKATPGWTGKTVTVQTREYYDGHYVTVQAQLRAYPTPGDSIVDHAKFLLYAGKGKTNRYANLIGANYDDACHLVQRGGYASDPQYANKLLSIIHTYRLDTYDDAHSQA